MPGIKRFLGKAGKFAGKAILKEAGLIEGRSNIKLTEDVKEDIAEAVYAGMLQALRDFNDEQAEPTNS